MELGKACVDAAATMFAKASATFWKSGAAELAHTIGSASRMNASLDMFSKYNNNALYYFFFFCMACALATRLGHGMLWLCAHCFAASFFFTLRWRGCLSGSGRGLSFELLKKLNQNCELSFEPSFSPAAKA